MGQVESQSNAVGQFTINNVDPGFVIVSNDLPGVLQFNPSESCVVSFGIDKQTSPSFQHKRLSSVTVDDAMQVRNAFVTVGAVCEENAHTYSASRQTDRCTAKGMKETFQKHASQVGIGGLFVFHFSGHGISVGNNEWGLAPADFDYSRDTYITADVLGKWLNEIECNAKYILFTLDCCYAGGIGKELATLPIVNRLVDLYVMSACMANETSVVLGPLGNSIFTYFLSNAIVLFRKTSGTLPIQEIFLECQICCECLTAMLVMYNEQSGLNIKSMQPQMSIRNIISNQDYPDVGVGRFQYALELYNHALPIDPLDKKSVAYLDTLSDLPDGPLIQFEKRHMLQGKIMETVLCSLMYSIASIEVACDTNLNRMKNPNLSITTFIQVASTIDMIHQRLEIPENIFFLGWLFYKEVLKKHSIKMAGMNHLHERLSHSKKFNAPLIRMIPHTGGEDMTDSNEVEGLVRYGYILKIIVDMKNFLTLQIDQFFAMIGDTFKNQPDL